ncbi:MAG TPA: hypothetical protein VF584_05740 [Longimicrobium sp.]|jgi:hypothetical protein
MKMRGILGAVAASLTLLYPARAQQPSSAPEFITAVPESPAFIFLNASPTKVTRPGATRDFGASLINGINDEGKVQQGFALEATPIGVVPGFNLTLPEYRKWPNFVAANAQLSLGTVRAAADSASTDLAVGLRLTLLDQGDPLLNQTFTTELGAQLRKCTAIDPNKPDDENEKAIAACADSVTSEAYGTWTKAHWNARRVAIGVAGGTRLEQSSLSETDGLGAQFWAVAANPIGTRAQIIGQLTGGRRTFGTDTVASTRITYGARLVGGSATFNGFAELVGEHSSLTSETTALWSGGIEFRISEDLWIATGLGTRYHELEKDARSVVIANLRWGMTSKSRFASLR